MYLDNEKNFCKNLIFPLDKREKWVYNTIKRLNSCSTDNPNGGGERMENDMPHCDVCCVHENLVKNLAEIMPDDDKLIDLAELFKVFGDSTRIKILTALSGGELCVCDISSAVGMTSSAVSHQLKILKNAKLVKFRRDGKTVFYSLADSHVNIILRQGLDHVSE
jgi:ArsR family transcriptional regulator